MGVPYSYRNKISLKDLGNLPGTISVIIGMAYYAELGGSDMAESKRTAQYRKLIGVYVAESTFVELEAIRERTGVPTSWFVRDLIKGALERGETLSLVSSAHVEQEAS